MNFTATHTELEESDYLADVEEDENELENKLVLEECQSMLSTILKLHIHIQVLFALCCDEVMMFVYMRPCNSNISHG